MTARERLGQVDQGARQVLRALARRAKKIFAPPALSCALLSLALLARSGLLFGAPATRVMLQLEGPPDCNDAPRLAQEVQRRGDVEMASDAAGAQARVEVAIASSEAGFEASVVIRRGSAVESRRVIAGSTCAEIMEGTALIVAVALQPPHPPERPRGDPIPPAVASAEARPEWRWGGGTQASLATGIAPAPMAAIEIFADARSEREGSAPSLRVGLRHATRSGLNLPIGRAAYRLDAGTLSVCPLHLRPAGAISVRPCTSVVIGRLQASGSGLSLSLSDQHPWLGAGLSLRFDVRLLRVLVLELEGGSEVALTPGVFRVDNREVHRTSRFGARAAVGLVASF